MKFEALKTIILASIFLFSCNNSAKETSRPVQTKITMETTKEEANTKSKSILFYGDSLTAGLGLEEEESFPSLIQDRIDSLDLDYEVINAGLSGETTAGGKGRIDWVLNKPVDIFVLELGANDMLRGLSLEETDKNLRAIIEVVKTKSPAAKIIIAGMEAPPNMGQAYMENFKNIFSSIASDYDAGYIPFLLKGLEGKPDMSIGDGKHPNAEGQKVVRENVWNVLKNYL